MADPGAAGGERPRGLRRRLLEPHDPLTSLVLTIPVFLVYHLGILLIDLRNGVDVTSFLVVRLRQWHELAYVAVTVAIAAGIVAAAWFLRRRGKLQPTALVPVLLESVVLSVVMLLLVGWATQQLLQIGPAALGPIDKVVMAAGAGYHEELVFRVALFGGGALLLERFAKVGELRAVLAAGLLSSLLFSAIHYVGELSDSFEVWSFVFRFLAGVYLAVVYRLRGFAVAVYTHAFYDLLVFFVL